MMMSLSLLLDGAASPLSAAPPSDSLSAMAARSVGTNEPDAARQPTITRYKCPQRRRALEAGRYGSMVNGTFLLPLGWEKLAGQTWSMRPYCRVCRTRRNIQRTDFESFIELARHSLCLCRTTTAWESPTGSQRIR